MSNYEHIRTSELLGQVRGIAIMTKTMSSTCQLADMISRSGIENVYNFPLEINPNMGSDYQIIARGGDSGDLANFSVLSVARDNGNQIFNVASGENFVNISLFTYVTDNVGRKVEISVGVKGIQKPDSMLAYKLLTDMFPKLTFQVFEKEPEYSEIKRFVEQNIVPHPTINH